MSEIFDPNGLGVKGNLFGLAVDQTEAQLIIIPVPWEVTVSSHEGTANAPHAILKASTQIDLHHHAIDNAWKSSIAMLPISNELKNESKSLRLRAKSHIQALEEGATIESGSVFTKKINEASENLNIYIKNLSSQYHKEGKLVGVVGGDHSTPLGLLRALATKYDRFGILQIDAHADLRKAFEGFTNSHGSIMYNALKLPSIARLVQVAVRDVCQEEIHMIDRSMGRVKTFFDQDLKARLYEGDTWKAICTEIIKELPNYVYISFDIDGLDPKLCPNTGTPVPGGLEFTQATYLFQELVMSGRKIIGFDLCEVAPSTNEWDANVGARILWELSQWTLASA
ncbi:MAG: agmatinase family protein [Cyclobacteriaceae bacterium]|nr:agmatinase family protein [Cyclobacteriaceae bacterium]